MRRIASIFCIVSLCTFQSLIGFADEGVSEELLKEVQELKKRVIELEKRCKSQDKTIEENRARWEEARRKLKDIETQALPEEEAGYKLVEGFSISVGATSVTQFAINPNTEPNDDDELCDATYSIDIEIEKTVGENGLAFLHLEAGDGNGLDGDEITTFSLVNQDAANSNNDVEVTQVWYEHVFFDSMAICTVGKLGTGDYLDNNEIATDETTQFLSGAFKRSTALEFPDDNTYGIRVGVIPNDWSEINLGIMDDNANWESVFEDPFLFAQVNLKPVFLGEDRPANYRIYCWYDDTAHVEWGGISNTEPNFGFGLSADQKVLDYLTLFARVGWEDPDVSTVELAWSTGFQLDGMPWGREEDYIGCAIGMDMPSGEYENANTSNHGDPEGHFEAYYNTKINDNLHISPHYQLIWNPNGQDDDQAINIFSLRGQVDF